MKNHTRNRLILVFDCVLLLGLVVSFFAYDNGYKEKLYAQNIDEISNVNQASANIASTFFSSREAKLRDVAVFIEREQMNLAESMDYIYDTNCDENKAFELIGPDGTGFRVTRTPDGLYAPLDYSSGYGDLCEIFKAGGEQPDSQTVGFAPEFTDGYTALKSFAVYNHVCLLDEKGQTTPYTLMLVSTSADFIDMINLKSGYEKLATTIINPSGAYIIGNSEFKSTGFFTYLSVFNDLTLDQQNEIQAEVLEKGRGSLAYRDGRERDCVFVYTRVPNKDWYCISSVPVAHFRNSNTEYSFALAVVVIMLLLLTVNLLYLSSLNRKLKNIAQKERVASAAKTEFLSRMSHDMRTPMNGIIGMTRLTQDIPDLPQEAQDNLAAVSDSSAYLLQLINDTLDMSKIESGKFTLNPEPVNAQTLVAHIISAVRPLADQKQIELELVPINTEAEYIRADRTRVQQIFLNILSNAVKFTPERGKIRIEVECLRRECGMVYDRISVQDNGCGMSEEFLKHIFEPFSQERTRIVDGQEGTGLGMAIVKSLVEMMGGTIEIASAPGEGTTVTVYISFQHIDGEIIQAAAQRQEINFLQGKRVLLAEDHPLNATIAIRLLNKRGVSTERAENGAVAVEMFGRAAPGYYDAVLMDIRMPEMNGLDAARAIRAMAREDAGQVPIIAMTANAYAEDIKAALAAGMDAHLAKPFEPEQLYQTLTEQISEKGDRRNER